MSKLRIYFDMNEEGVKPFKVEKDKIVLSEVDPSSENEISTEVLLPYKGESILMVLCDNNGNNPISVAETTLGEVYPNTGFLIGLETPVDKNVLDEEV